MNEIISRIEEVDKAIVFAITDRNYSDALLLMFYKYKLLGEKSQTTEKARQDFMNYIKKANGVSITEALFMELLKGLKQKGFIVE